jgi:hypothetical protein
MSDDVTRRYGERSITRPSPAAAALAMAVCVVTAAITERAASARADSRPPSVIPAIGATARFRIARTAQGNTGPRMAVSVVTLRRKTATTLTLEGLYDRPSERSALKVGADGSLEVSGDEKPKDDASLRDVMAGLNRLTGLFSGESRIPHDGWSASFRLTDVAGANSPVMIPIEVENANAADFEIHGVGQVTVQAPSQQAEAGPPRPFGGRFRPPGAFGGALPNAVGGADGTAASARQSVSVAVSVDGRIHHGTISKMSIVETRSITVDAQPYVNVSGWTFESIKP